MVAETSSDRICEIEPDWELQGHTYGLAQVVILRLARHDWFAGNQFILRLCRKQDLKAEGQSLFLRSLDQRSQDGALFSLRRLECQNQPSDRWFGLDGDGALLCPTLQLEDAHRCLDYDIGVLWPDGGEVAGECDAGPPEAEVGNGAIPRR